MARFSTYHVSMRLDRSNLHKVPKILGHGPTAIITTLDHKTAIKGYEVWHNGRLCAKAAYGNQTRIVREATVYGHLRAHPHILTLIDMVEVDPDVPSLLLELAPFGSIRNHTEYTPSQVNLPVPQLRAPPMGIRMHMARTVARTLQYIHSRGGITRNLSCANIFLFHNGTVKLGGFSGALLEEYEFVNSTQYETRYRMPLRGRKDRRSLDLVKQEIFALGMAIYELTGWKKPFDELRDNDDTDLHFISLKYELNHFPRISPGNPAEEVIWKCWLEKYDTVEEVVRDLAPRVLRSEADEDVVMEA